MPALKYGILVSLCVSLQIISDSHSCIIFPTSMHVFVGFILRVDVCMSPKYSKGKGKDWVRCMHGGVTRALRCCICQRANKKISATPNTDRPHNKHECTLTTTNSDKLRSIWTRQMTKPGLVHMCCHAPTTSSGGPSSPRPRPPLPPRPPRPPLPGDLPPNPLPRPPKLISDVFVGTFCGVWGAVAGVCSRLQLMMCRIEG